MEILFIFYSFVSPLFDIFRWLHKLFDPVSILKHQQRIKEELGNKLPQRRPRGVHREVIVRDVRRWNKYLNADTAGKGISPWFKVEVKGLYYGGLEVFLTPQRAIENEKGRWELIEHDDERDGVIVFPVGRIPYDWIEIVDELGDEYYSIPHIYCRFRLGSPYESIPFYLRHDDPEWFQEIEGYRPWENLRKKRRDILRGFLDNIHS